MEKLYTVKKKKNKKTKTRSDCGSNYELFIAKFRLNLKRVGKPLGHSDMT